MRRVIPFVLATLLTQVVMAQEKKIIFVCEHGAAKSVNAASYFNKLVKERNLDYVAECRGTSPDSVVSASTKAGLTNDKMFGPSTKPRKLLISDVVNAERIILFTKLPADINANIKIENWSDIQNVDGEYEKRRDAIVKKIGELLDSLEKK
jgi:arsenate reductase